ncbi:hypothetical protein QGN29_06630 [Temperatibacter marinus]|uniref:DUF1700 domain-containing protein n=1 Tax=Temperatibacter marinus TaxID=1456591 RepID=A0AA52EI36_9PROT|nr:hypothetical protein [Temperatibacter marinus]WND04048.1 hypothetical protein QGN29_06630 [Temperatibacter marinus]
MTLDFPIESKLAQKVWDNFKRELDHKLKDLSPSEQEEVSQELLSHLYESALNDPADLEEERYLNAIERLGSLDDTLTPLVEDLLLHSSLTKGNPFAVISSLKKTASKGLVHILGTCILGFGYFTCIMLFVMAIAHLFDPGVGIWLHESGSLSFSFSAQPDATQFLASYFSLAAIIFSGIGYLFLNRLLRFFISLSTQSKTY